MYNMFNVQVDADYCWHGLFTLYLQLVDNLNVQYFIKQYSMSSTLFAS